VGWNGKFTPGFIWTLLIARLTGISQAAVTHGVLTAIDSPSWRGLR
jgi:hypothetical protein